MKVTSVEIFDIHIDNWPQWHPVVVRVNTDEGISGLGEVGLAIGTGHSAGVGMAKDIAEQFMLGVDPFNTEKLWDDMFRHTFWAQGGGPVVYGGMSAMDIALWDIKGKALGLPLYKLLGGKTNLRLRTYASQIQFGWNPKKREVLTRPEEYAEVTRQVMAEGYDCVKIDPVIFDLEGNRAAWNLTNIFSQDRLALFRERIAAVREAGGPDLDIIVEMHSLLSTTTAIQLADVFEEFDCFFYEEPVNYLNEKLHSMVAHNVRTPTAAGEHLYTRWGYREYFENQSLAVIQPDLALVGGISEGKKICDYAHIYDITVQCHVCGSPVAIAAALHLETAIPNFIIHEHHTNAIKEANIAICQQNYQPAGGFYEVPESPGLGVDLNDDFVKRSPHIVVK
ncbi:MAG TPA: mandelate racemase/muconate lactonizing enzyme family protein [Chloroflexi bacterium]|jgi:galactonate dehydratase|nr:mandelate racemase/muconate lactonizing enzyme family protein [Chloroflexota bacterium]